MFAVVVLVSYIAQNERIMPFLSITEESTDMSFRRFLLLSTLLSSSFITTPARAQLAVGQLERRLTDVCALLTDRPSGYDTLFTDAFRAQVSAAQLTAGLQQISGLCGTCTGHVITKRLSPYAGTANLRSTRGYIIPVNISIEERAPFRIAGLLLRNPIKENSSIDSILAELKALPGTTSLYVERFGDEKPLIEHNAEAILPIGSSFKLYILGELARSIASGTRQWTSIATLKPSLRSFPSGKLQDWPEGSPLTMHTLASLMISQSDNTATDVLLHEVGRENVERMQAAMGHHQPARNKPFMSTREMFTLKFSDGGQRARRYYAMNEADRRAMLRNEIASINRDSVSFVPVPICADSVEWFASTHDLCKAMDWLRNAANSDAGKPVLGILSINPGLEIDEDQWSTICYKGGSETGVLNMTYLLKDVKGDWYAVSMSWCNPAAPLQETTFFGLMGTLLRMIRH